MIDEPTGITRAAACAIPVTPVEIDLQNRPELLGGLPGRRDGGPHAGVVHQDVDRAERLDGLIDEPRAVLRTGHVGLHDQRAPPSSFDKPAGFGEPVDASGAERDVGAGLGERPRGGHAQPGRGAGDHRHLAVSSNRSSTVIDPHSQARAPNPINPTNRYTVGRLMW